MGMRGGCRRCSFVGLRRRAARRVEGRERLRRPASQVRSPGTPVAPSRDAPISESRVVPPGDYSFAAQCDGAKV
jgi:hypothetical protein